ETNDTKKTKNTKDEKGDDTTMTSALTPSSEELLPDKEGAEPLIGYKRVVVPIGDTAPKGAVLMQVYVLGDESYKLRAMMDGAVESNACDRKSLEEVIRESNDVRSRGSDGTKRRKVEEATVQYDKKKRKTLRKIETVKDGIGELEEELETLTEAFEKYRKY
ncbi:hypothetical protein BGZ49_004560, partial [Haplosporangium sp. Z 27]